MQIHRILPMLALAACARGQQSGDLNLSCVKSLVLPSFPAIAKQARAEGWFFAKVIVGSTGRAADVKIDQKSGFKGAVAQLFVAAIDAQLRAAQFEVSCQGKSVSLEFSFEFHEDLPANREPDRMVFRGPNVFVIGSPPVLLNF